MSTILEEYFLLHIQMPTVDKMSQSFISLSISVLLIHERVRGNKLLGAIIQ